MHAYSPQRLDRNNPLHSVPSQRTRTGSFLLEKVVVSVENLQAMLDNKPSVTKLTQSLRHLSTPYERESKGQEETIFDLFKIPNKNEASIGRLLSVCFSSKTSLTDGSGVEVIRFKRRRSEIQENDGEGEGDREGGGGTKL